jgi:type III pantothenate kinase
MNAVVDIGNTKVKVGLFAKKANMKISIIDIKKLIVFLTKEQVINVLICGIINKTFLKEIKEIGVNLKIFTIKTPLPIFTTYSTPKSLGVDRLAACVGARNYVQGNVLIIDAGTCITYDILTKKNEHIGGIISPGLYMRLEAMHMLTANLPLVTFKKTILIGKTTEECLQSGVSNGALAEMRGLIMNFQKKFEDLSIIIGGGDAVFFDKNLEFSIFVASYLTLEGLHTIFKYNE